LKNQTNKGKNEKISHQWTEESPESKARWFQSLSMAERMEQLCLFTDFILAINPRIGEMKDAQPTSRSVRLLRKTSS
jgi:hypothetical protein